MCGIAGIMLKNKDDAGLQIIRMLEAIEHRGPDSTGMAVFDMHGEQLRMVIGCPDKRKLKKVTDKLEQEKIEWGEIRQFPNFCLITAMPRQDDEYQKVLCVIRGLSGVCLYSCGRYMTIIKDTYLPEEFSRVFSVDEIKGTFAIGHVRLATESRVNPFWSHPFQSLAMPDLSIVHNGQITNFFKKRRQLEKRGYLFQTDNDSEVIAQEIAYYILEHGMTFEDALRTVAEGLDGAFSFIVASANAIGIAKDRLATKPLMVAETELAVAMASEEIAIEVVLGSAASARELPPGEVYVWKM